MLKRCIYVVAVVILVSLAPVLMASRGGAVPGYSGGSAWTPQGQNCTACHRFESGTGSVTLQGMPDRYQSGRTYELSVLIADADQRGAGFQVSVEGDSGFAGQLLITDSVRTKFAGGDEGFVTHTRDGVDDSVAD